MLILFVLTLHIWTLQSQTMQMMYSVVARELRELQVDAHPQDYLNFYCIGNREEPPKDVSTTNGDKVFTWEKFGLFFSEVY